MPETVPAQQAPGAPPAKLWADVLQQSPACETQARAPKEEPLGQPQEAAEKPEHSRPHVGISRSGCSEEDGRSSGHGGGGSGTAPTEDQDPAAAIFEGCAHGASDANPFDGAILVANVGAGESDAVEDGGRVQPNMTVTDEPRAEPARASVSPERQSRSPTRPEVPRVTIPTTLAAPGPISPFACGTERPCGLRDRRVGANA